MLSRNIAFWQKGASHFVCEQMISKPGYDIHCSFFSILLKLVKESFKKYPFTVSDLVAIFGLFWDLKKCWYDCHFFVICLHSDVASWNNYLAIQHICIVYQYIS